MAAQAFLFNAVFFTYGLVLTRAYHVPAQNIGVYVLPLALGNLMGPLLLGALFDTLGRRRMIAGTYGLSGVLMARPAGRSMPACWMPGRRRRAGWACSSSPPPRQVRPI